MIVYGTKATLLKSELIYGKCPNCNTDNSVQMSVFQRYAHIFWIPFFPIGKTGVSVCSNCRQALKLKNMPASLKLSYDNLASQTAQPIWTFAGIGVVAIIAAAVAINDSHKTKARNQFVLAPKADDVLEVKVDTVYTLFKLTAVDKDSLHFLMNSFQTSDESGLSGLIIKPYDTTKYIMAKSKLIELNKQDRVVDIIRP